MDTWRLYTANQIPRYEVLNGIHAGGFGPGAINVHTYAIGESVKC